MALPAPSRQRVVDDRAIITREWLNWLDSIVVEATTPPDPTELDASLLVGLVPLASIQDLMDANISPVAAIQWSKISKVGSSLADLETRDAADLEPGTLPPNVDFTVDLGSGRRSGTFDVAASGFTVGQNVTLVQTAKPIASKGNARDEFEMDAIVVTGYVVDATTLRAFWFSANGSVVVGTYAFAYGVNG